MDMFSSDLWADGSGVVPFGAVPVYWVTTEHELFAAEPPSSANLGGDDEEALVCEECESSLAVVWSELDEEALCAKCCALLYPQSSTGRPHTALSGFKVRLLCAGDTSTLMRKPVQVVGDEAAASQQQPDYFGGIITEEMWEGMGRNLRVPAAVEAPRKNTYKAHARFNRSKPKFSEGDVVVFDVEDILPSEVQGHARLPTWRNREIWGRVMGTAHPRLGQYGHAVRDGDEHTAHFRVRCRRWVAVHNPTTAGGDPLSTEPEVGVLSGGRCGAYATEMAQADDLFEERKLLDRKKEQLEAGALTMPGFKPAPFARERALAWIRDRQLRIAIAYRTHAAAEISDGAQADGSSFPTVLVLPESKLFAPAEKRAALCRRRAHQLTVTLTILDAAAYEQNLVRSFLQWVGFTYVSLEEERDAAARLLQRASRGLSLRLHAAALEAARQAEKNKGKREFKFLTRDEEKRTGFTTDGKAYFSTLHECNLYAGVVREGVRTVLGVMHRAVLADARNAVRRWKGMVAGLKSAELAAVPHLGVHVVPPLGSGPPASVDRTAAPSPAPSAPPAPPAAPPAAPWHAAVGVLGLPPLPRTYSSVDPRSGNVVVEGGMAQKYNSYVASLAGPTDGSNWLVKGKVLVGCYPEGKARKRGRQPDPPSAAAQILLSGAGGLTVCVMAPNELRDLERLNGLPPLEDGLVKEHLSILAALKGTAVRMAAAAKELQAAAAALPQYRPSDLRYAAAKAALQEAVAKERLAMGQKERAEASLAKFPKAARIIYLPCEEGAAPALSALLPVLEAAEAHLRASKHHGVFVMSRLGHGRAATVGACLMGRLYGSPCREVLERLRASHNARPTVANCGRVIPSPSTLAQVSLVEHVLSVNESIYAATMHRDGAPGNAASGLGERLVAFPKLRGRGLPVPLPPQDRTAALLANRLKGATDPNQAGGGGGGGGGSDRQGGGGGPPRRRQGDRQGGAKAGQPRSGGGRGRTAGGGGDGDVVEEPEVVRPRLTFPKLPCPASPGNRDLRLTTSMEEEARGRDGSVLAIRPPRLGLEM